MGILRLICLRRKDSWNPPMLGMLITIKIRWKPPSGANIRVASSPPWAATASCPKMEMDRLKYQQLEIAQPHEPRGLCGTRGLVCSLWVPDHRIGGWRGQKSGNFGHHPDHIIFMQITIDWDTTKQRLFWFWIWEQILYIQIFEPYLRDWRLSNDMEAETRRGILKIFKIVHLVSRYADALRVHFNCIFSNHATEFNNQLFERYTSIPKICGSFRAPQFSFNHLAISFHVLSSMTLAPSGQILMQAQQRMQSSTLVATLPSIEMAAVGHASAHAPQTVHMSSLVIGETAIDLAPPAS